MFRRLIGSLPEDPSWEPDLTKLGYFINKRSQIRKIKSPEERFQFKVTENDRFNEVHKEAFHKCLREEITRRMEQSGAPALYLPQLTTAKPSEPAVPIFTTRPGDLKTKKNVIIIINDHMQDLGVWAYRQICDDGFDAGSCTGTIQALKLGQYTSKSDPGLVILNPGQYYYSHREQRALTHESWEALPKKSLYHATIKADEMHNLIPGSRDKHEHITTAFNTVLLNDAFIRPDADLYLVGIGEGGNALLAHLNNHWSALAPRVKAAAWVHPYADPDSLAPAFARFLETRSRAWTVSLAPLGTCLAVPHHGPRRARPTDNTPRTWEQLDEDDESGFAEPVACAIFSGGEDQFIECVFPKIQRVVFDFFDEVKRGGEGYVNPYFEAVKPSRDLYGTGDGGADSDGADPDADTEAEAEAATAETGFSHVARDLVIAKIDKEGTIVASSDEQERAEEKVRKVTLQKGEVEVAGVAIAKDLLVEAGLD